MRSVIIFVRVMDLHIIFRVILWYRLGHWFTLVRQPLVIRVTGIGLARLLPLPDPLHQLLGRVEHTAGLFATLVAPLRLLVVLKGTFLTEVVLTPEKRRCFMEKLDKKGSPGNYGSVEHFPTE